MGLIKKFEIGEATIKIVQSNDTEFGFASTIIILLLRVNKCISKAYTWA